ncbi:MAG: hypothetical protein LC775_05710, partial [Acidobacteria bacterium]|nr:hypothetical protein [Acidobacteriota bacterium]
DYGTDGQLGAEGHIDEWVKGLLDVCRELARVLKPSGALWLNLGDGYSRHPREGTLKKSLLLGPERVALALTDEGWLLRNKVIWAKTNPMPASVTDRLACGYEVIYFLTRQRNYHFDLNAIRVPAVTPTHARPVSRASHYPPRAAVPHVGQTPRIDLNCGLAALKAGGQEHHPLGKNPETSGLLLPPATGVPTSLPSLSGWRDGRCWPPARRRSAPPAGFPGNDHCNGCTAACWRPVHCARHVAVTSTAMSSANQVWSWTRFWAAARSP